MGSRYVWILRGLMLCFGAGNCALWCCVCWVLDDKYLCRVKPNGLKVRDVCVFNIWGY
jgi:hypothetical protein